MTSGYPKFQPDLRRTLADMTSAYRFVVTLGEDPPRPLIWHRSNGQAYHMEYRRERGAIKARDRVRGETSWADEVRVYDKTEARFL